MMISADIERCFSERDSLIERHRHYARALAVEVMSHLGAPGQLDLRDLIAYAELGLVEAAERYDHQRGIAFTTFSYYRIRGAIYDGLRQIGWLSRSQYHRVRFAAHANRLRQSETDDDLHRGGATTREADIAAVQNSLELLIPVYLLSLDSTENLPELVDQTADQSETFEDDELRKLTRALVAELSPDDRFLLEEIYYRNASMVNVAGKIGASKSWVSRLHARAVRHLRDLMIAKGIIENSEHTFDAL